MADVRTYIKLHDGLPDHPKIDGLSDKAFRLLISTWCWCSRHLTDGVIPNATWTKRGTAKTRQELVTAGLILQENGHVVAHDYLEHQRSSEQVAEVRAAKRRAGTLGNHNRWHKSRGVIDMDCPYCADSPLGTSQVRSQTQSHMRSQKRSQTDRKTSPETETDTETKELAGLDGGGEVLLADASDTPTTPPNPYRCLDHQHPDDPGPCRPCRDARLRQEQLAELAARTARLNQVHDARAKAETRAAAIAACDLCDDTGYAGHRVCDHDPDSATRARNGAALARAALAKEPA